MAGADGITAEEGMAQMSEKFRAMGGKVYVETTEAVKASNAKL